MKLLRLVTGWASVLMASAMLLGAPTTAEWDQPAAALAEQIAGVLGPGQTALTLRNLSSIADSDIPAIRTMLEKDLKAHGITMASGESANSLRITLSQTDRERLWVAEVIQGNETRVIIVPAGSGPAQNSAAADYMTLRTERLPILHSLSDDPAIAAFETGSSLVILRPEAIDLLAFGEGGWQHQKYFALGDHRQLARDERGMMFPAPDGSSFRAFTGRMECSGNYAATPTAAAHPADGWTVNCHQSDEPWPILHNNDPTNPVTIKAFYNAARNYFTGVITPNLGVDLPPFYSAALLSRPNGPALLVGGVNGKMQLVDSGILKPVSGARDWGSDFAVLQSGCGSGAQVIASGSGEAAGDSLRAYELPAQEAIPASAPLAMNGTVTALWTSPDGKSLLAAVRQTSGDYEVDRVTALCN